MLFKKAPRPPLPPHLCLSLVFASAVFISGSLQTDFRAQSCMDFAPNKSRTPPATSALVKGAVLVGLMEQSQQSGPGDRGGALKLGVGVTDP